MNNFICKYFTYSINGKYKCVKNGFYNCHNGCKYYNNCDNCYNKEIRKWNGRNNWTLIKCKECDK